MRTFLTIGLGRAVPSLLHGPEVPIAKQNLEFAELKSGSRIWPQGISEVQLWDSEKGRVNVALPPPGKPAAEEKPITKKKIQ